MMKFIYQYDKGSPLIEVTVPNNDANMDEVFEVFKSFLLAAGFQQKTIEEYFDD